MNEEKNMIENFGGIINFLAVLLPAVMGSLS
jgi:hypothetical protein